MLELGGATTASTAIEPTAGGCRIYFLRQGHRIRGVVLRRDVAERAGCGGMAPTEVGRAWTRPASTSTRSRSSRTRRLVSQLSRIRSNCSLRRWTNCVSPSAPSSPLACAVHDRSAGSILENVTLCTTQRKILLTNPWLSAIVPCSHTLPCRAIGSFSILRVLCNADAPVRWRPGRRDIPECGGAEHPPSLGLPSGTRPRAS